MAKTKIINPQKLSPTLSDQEEAWLVRETGGGRLSSEAMSIYRTVRRNRIASATALSNRLGYSTHIAKKGLAELEGRNMIELHLRRGCPSVVLNPEEEWKSVASIVKLHGRPQTVEAIGDRPESLQDVRTVWALCRFGDRHTGRVYWALWEFARKGSFTFEALAAETHMREADAYAAVEALRATGLVYIRESDKVITVTAPEGAVEIDNMQLGEEDIHVWLQDTRCIVAPFDPSKRRNDTRKKSQTKLILDYFAALNEANIRYKQWLQSRSGNTRMINKGKPGVAKNEYWTAARLAKQYSFDELQPLLTIYMLDYDHDNISQYGRTLYTLTRIWDELFTDESGKIASGKWKQLLHRSGMTEWLPEEQVVDEDEAEESHKNGASI